MRNRQEARLSIRKGLALAVWLGLGSSVMAQFGAPPPAEIQLDQIQLPPGFRIDLYTSDVPDARSMTLGSEGTLFVSTRREGAVYAVVDRDGDQVGDEVLTLAKEMSTPNGVAFHEGNLYVAETHQIRRFNDIESSLSNPPDPVLIRDGFPKDRRHSWRFIAMGPDGWLYMPVGAPCNSCRPEDERYASLLRMKPDGSGLEVFAHGIRNTVGFDWHPETRDVGRWSRGFKAFWYSALILPLRITFGCFI